MSWGIAFRVRQHLKGSLYVLPFIGALLGFVVTIGVLVVQMATGTLSPRFMRLWYRDLLQKIVLATFAGTLTFSFSLLRHVEDDAVPNVGVTLAGVLVSASLLLLLLYLDRFTHSLRPVAVAALVAGAGRRVLEALPAAKTAAWDEPGVRPAGPATAVRTARAGAIQAVDVRGLLALARQHDCVLVLRHSVGDFVPTGATLVEVLGPAPPTVQRRVRRMFALGRERTIEQDPAFALRILVDIAIRALSPAVNDPTTAVQVSGRLRALLEELRAGVAPERRAAVDAELRKLGRASPPASPTTGTAGWPTRATARASVARRGHLPASSARVRDCLSPSGGSRWCRCRRVRARAASAGGAGPASGPVAAGPRCRG